MEIKELRDNARKNYNGTCRVCKVCDGRACAGEVPGMGGAGTGSTFTGNVKSLAKIKLKLKTLHDAKNPNMSKTIFGKKLSAPIMIAPITGSSLNFGGYLDEKEYAEIVVEGAKKTGVLAMTGDTAKPEFYEYGLDAMKDIQLGIPTIKPREVEAVIEKIKLAEKINVPAIAIDVDGAGLVTMALLGQPVGPKSESEIKRIVESTDLPVILKGIMTKEEARIAVNAGAKAIVVSNHGGRVLDSVVGVSEVLEEIAKEVKGEILIMADSGVRSGIDIYKYLALGADVVLVGRPIITGAVGGKVEGVQLILDNMKNELYKAMILTGCSEIEDITVQNIYRA